MLTLSKNAAAMAMNPPSSLPRRLPVEPCEVQMDNAEWRQENSKRSLERERENSVA
jgi:hypothetical protein